MIRLGLGLCDSGEPGTISSPPAPPVQNAPLDPVIATAGTGLLPTDLSGAFSGEGLIYSLPVPRAGLTLHSLTGSLEIDTAATGFLSAEPITIRVSNAGGTLDGDLQLSVDPQDGVLVTIQGLTNNPTHGPTAEIGSTLSIVVPAYSGGLLYQWYTEESGDLAGATLATLEVPGTVDTLDLGCRVTADFALPQPVPVATVRQVPPTAGSLDPAALALTGGIETLPVASAFSGAALSYALISPPAGVTIAPATGLLSIDTAVTGSFGPTDITVAASNSGGGVNTTLSLSVADMPVNQSLPVFSGTPQIGQTLTVIPGTWTGSPVLTYQWLRDGAAIPGATGLTYVLQAADDTALITVREIPDGITQAAVEGAEIFVRYPAPVAGSFNDQVFASGPSSQSIDVSTAFTGENIIYSSTDDDLFPVDPDTGIIEIDTSGALVQTGVTITGTNSGGSDDLTFNVTVAQSDNRTIEFDGNDGFRQDVSNLDLTLSWTTDGFWTSCLYYYDGATPGIDNAALMGFANSSSGSDYFLMTPVTASIRATTTTFAGSDTVPSLPGWYRVTARWYSDGAGGGIVWHKVGAIAAKSTNRGSEPSFASINHFALGYSPDSSPTSFNGRAFDFAIGTGDPEAMHDALTAETDVTTKRVEDYDFAGDAGCTLVNYWRGSAVDTSGAVSVSDTALDDAQGTANTWTLRGDPQYSTHQPFQVPPFPQWTTPPAISRSGDDITIVPGVASGAPTPTVTNTLYWNGTNVTGSLVGNTYTKSGKGQAVLVSLATAPEGYIIEVLDLWDENTQPSAASNMNTYEMSGVAYNGVYAQFSAVATVGRYLRSEFDNEFLCAPVICESSVSVTAHYPEYQTLASGRKVNGAMKNVPVRKGSNSSAIQGWDSLHQTYTDSLNAADNYPVTLSSGDSLLIAVSDITSTSKKRPLNRYGLVQVNPTGTTLPTADAIPPMPYDYGTNVSKPMRRWADVTGTLPGLDYSGVAETPPTVSDSFMRPIIDPITNWGREFTQASRHVRTYGRDLENGYADELAYLMGDDVDSDKDLMLASLVRSGAWTYDAFTRYTATNSDVPWQADGGHNHGRKPLMVFAGHMLGDNTMRNVVAQTDPTSQTGGLQEDVMTAYVSQSLLDIMALGQGNGWSPQYSSNGVAAYTSGMYNSGVYPMPDWRGRAAEANMNAHGGAHPYRNTGNHQVHFAVVLALLACGLKTAWGHDPFFDQQIRHWKIKTGEADPWIGRGDSTPNSYTQPAGWTTSIYTGYAYDAFTNHIASVYTYPWGGRP